MAARNGTQYLENLKANQPEVYLNGRRVEDVTTEPIFAGPLVSVMQQYDLQHEPANADVMTFADPDTGVHHSTSFLLPRSKEELGEMLTELELFRAAYYGAEAMAAPGHDGIWAVHQQALAATRLRAPQVYARLVEIVQILAGGGFFYAPTQGDLDNEALRPYIDKYVRGRPGISAQERIALFKLAWDVTGDSFGSRMAQYVRFYSGDPIRNTAGYYLGYPLKDALFDVVDRALGAVADLDVPLSSVDGRDQGTRRPPVPGVMSGAYPANSVPRPG